jgi:type I restriction-modification system DNA methylase subunit
MAKRADAKKAANPASTEVDAYIFIKEQLRKQGWDARNPSRVAGGQVWTQTECLAHPEIKTHFVLDHPENVVKVTEKVLWVIEAKRTHKEIEKAVGEAEDYARKLNASQLFKAAFVSGVAGNEVDTFVIRTRYLKDGKFLPVTMNTVEVTGFLTPDNCAHVLHTDQPNIDNPPIDEKKFIARAERINEILHLGAVNPHQRAVVMASLLLSKLSSTGPNIEEKVTAVLIDDINARTRSVLRAQKKTEFEELIRITPPTSQDNHFKFRQAIVDTIQELDLLNIRSAMNSGVDWLGAFYEVFLKYASWSQDLGIVLTPRHVTRWVAGVMDVRPNDLILDPTCGTGGFLVAAFDAVKQKATPHQVGLFKRNAVFGVEQDEGIAALAVVNMIFRGDGKNNIIDGNCFAKFLKPFSNDGTPTAKYTTEQSQTPPITKVMMNPPFSLKKGTEKEYKFVEHALHQMQHGGLLFSVLPYSAMVKPGGYRGWRKNQLLPHHTLLSVVTFPGDLFYPVGVHSVGIFVRKGIPHSKDQNVLWLRAINDGLVKSKGKRLPNPKAPNDLATVSPLLGAFLANPEYPVPSIDRFQKACPIDFGDKLLELVPENYLDETPATDGEMQDGVERVLRDTAAFLIGERRGAWGGNTARLK